MPLTLDDTMIRILTDPAALREFLAKSLAEQDKAKAKKREYYHRNKEAINARRAAKYAASKNPPPPPPLDPSAKTDGLPIV